MHRILPTRCNLDAPHRSLRSDPVAGGVIARVAFLALLIAGCGRHGFSEEGVFSAIPISEDSAVVGCTLDIRSDGPDSYAVMWHEYPAPDSDRHSVMFARLSTAGQVIAGPEVVETIEGRVRKMWLHLGETGGYQGFYRHSASGDLRAVSLDQDGRLKTVDDLFYVTDEAVLVRDDVGFSLFYEDGEHLHHGTISASGEMLSAPVDYDLPVGRDESGNDVLESPRAISTETGIHLVFEHSWGSQVGYARLDHSGNFIEGHLQDFGAHYGPSIADDGAGNMIMAWYDDDQLTEFALNKTGDPVWGGVRQEVALNRQESPTMSMVGGNGRIAMVWESDADTILPQIMFRDVGLEVSQVNEPEPIGTPGYAHSCPRIARGENHFGIAFRTEIDGEHRLFVGIRHD